MSDPLTTRINSSVQKTYEWIRDVGELLETDERQTAYQALRSVLHALRDRLPAEEAANLAAELPVFLRGVYYEGWRPAATPVKMNPDQFLGRIAEEVRKDGSDGDPRKFARAVLGVLRQRVSAGEISDVRGALPEAFSDLWTAA